MRNKIFMTLALLLTAVTGAWADETYTITFAANGNTKTVENVTLPKTFQCNYDKANGELDLILKELYSWTGNANQTFCDGETTPTSSDENKVVAGSDNGDHYITINNVFEGTVTITGYYVVNSVVIETPYSLEISIAAAGPATFPFPITWDATNKTTGFNQPAGNVFMNVEYYPVAELTKAPAAKSNIQAATADAIVTAGTVAMIGQTENAQGTLMYYAVQSETAPDAPDYDNQNWSDKEPTAADFNQGNVYVWYYVKGNDGDAESTFNDGAITKLGETGYVTLAAPPTYDVTFAEGVNPEPPAEPEWTASPNADVKKGQTVTVTYTGQRKVMGVKAEKKGGAPDPKLATPLTIEAITPGIISVSSPKEGMQFSLDGGATKNAVTTGQIVLAAGDKVQFYGNGTSITSYYGTTITGSGNDFTCKVYGNIMSLVDETGFATAKKLSANPTFYRLFAQNAMLTDASGLLLPATELAQECYSQMFRDCTALTAAPEELPATELAGNCYRSMFMGCTALTTAPVLPATELVERCYYQMFINCSKLATVTCLAESGINTNYSTNNWLRGAGSDVQGTKTVNTVSTANWPSGDNGIPTGWTRVNVDN